MGSAVLAYSGGVDSTFLLSVASGVLKEKLLAVTAVSETYPAGERAAARLTARRLGARHKMIRTRELQDKRFVMNSPRRCYFCKKELFGRLKEVAARGGFRWVMDATNVSDLNDYRPGSQAKARLGVRSPLVEAGFTKEEIRRLSRGMGLNWDKPALACLASRVPYGRRISGALLRKIGLGESFLRRAGARQVRLRDYGDLCRIEVEKEALTRILARRESLVKRLKKLGYRYVTLDLEGYRTGSLNPAFKNRRTREVNV